MLLYIQITGKVIQKILKLFNLQRSVFTMLKKIVSGMLAAGMMLASVSAFHLQAYRRLDSYVFRQNAPYMIPFQAVISSELQNNRKSDREGEAL